MMLPGFCTECHKVKQVRVNMARLHPNNVYVGICNACAEKARARNTRRAL